MGLLVAILITLAVLGSVLWVMPSPREKRIIAMRQKALSLGIKVRLLDQQLAGKFFPWCEDYRQYVLYEKYFQNENKNIRTPIVVRLSKDFVPHELDGEHPLHTYLKEGGILERLPESAEALIFYSGSVSLLWMEKEGLEVLDEVSKCLEESIEAVRTTAS